MREREGRTQADPSGARRDTGAGMAEQGAPQVMADPAIPMLAGGMSTMEGIWRESGGNMQLGARTRGEVDVGP